MTHAEGAATASLEVVWLMLRTCSLTLDFASTIEPVEVPEAAVDRARVKAIALLAFGAPWMRILAADDSDMVLDVVESDEEDTRGDEGKEGRSVTRREHLDL